MTGHRFSRRGEPPTAYEIELLAAASSDNVWAQLAQLIGAKALLVVLDELGSEKIHIPTRAGLMQRLHTPLRDERIRAHRANGRDPAEIAALEGVTVWTVYKALGSVGSDGTRVQSEPC